MPLANLKMFGMNIYLLIALLIAAVIVLAIVLAAWTSLNIGMWQRQKRKAEQEERLRKLRPDGQPYPPAARGICDRCSRGLEKVYHLPSGRRLCPDCYDAEEGQARGVDLPSKPG